MSGHAQQEPKSLDPYLGSRNLGPFTLYKGRLRGDLTHVYKYLRYMRKRDMAKIFSVVSGDWTRGNRHKMEHSKLCTTSSDGDGALEQAAYRG